MYAYGVVHIGTIAFSKHGISNVSIVQLLFVPFSVRNNTQILPCVLCNLKLAYFIIWMP